MKKFESKSELRKFIRKHIPVMVKAKTGRLVEIFKTNNGFQTVVEQLADALWENDESENEIYLWMCPSCHAKVSAKCEACGYVGRLKT